MGSTRQGADPVGDRLREFARCHGRIPTRDEVRQIVSAAGATLDRLGRVTTPRAVEPAVTAADVAADVATSPPSVPPWSGTRDPIGPTADRERGAVPTRPPQPHPSAHPDPDADADADADPDPDPDPDADPDPDPDPDADPDPDPDPDADPDADADADPDDDGVLVGAALSLSGDKDVRRAVDDLVDDWHRIGGGLTRADVDRIVAKRLLGAKRHAEIVARLLDLGMLDLEPDTAPGTANGRVVRDGDSRDAVTVTRDQLDDYLRLIGGHGLLRAHDEVRLGRAIQAGAAADEALASGTTDRGEPRNRAALEEVSGAGRDAHQQLVVRNLRLVVSIAKVAARRPGGLELSDVIQHGNIGLMRAAERFDPNLGFKFSTYATWWIRQSIDRGQANDSRTIRYPVHFVEDVRRVQKARAALARRHGNPPTVEELATETQMGRAAVQAVIDYSRSVVSLDASIAEEGTTTLSDLLAAREDPDHRFDPGEWALRAAMRREIDELLTELLTPREAHIVKRRYGLVDGEIDTLDEIASDFDLTRERIRQIQRKALERLAGSRQARPLYEYLHERSDDLPAAPVGGWVDHALDVREARARRAARRRAAPAAAGVDPVAQGRHR